MILVTDFGDKFLGDEQLMVRTNLSLPFKFEITWSLKSGILNIFWLKIEVWLWKCVLFSLVICVQNGINE